MSEVINAKIEVLKNAIEIAPHPALIYAARFLLSEYDRDRLPDWVAALANGSAETWPDLLEVVISDMKAGDE